MNTTNTQYFVFCDGAAPGPGSGLKPGYFCSLVVKPNSRKPVPWTSVPDILDIGSKHCTAAMICGHHGATTSPRMEFVAAFEALAWISARNSCANVSIISDHENLVKFIEKVYKCTKGCESIVTSNGGELDANNKFSSFKNLLVKSEHVNASHAKKKTKPTHFLNQVSDFICTFLAPASSGKPMSVWTITDCSSGSVKTLETKTYI